MNGMIEYYARVEGFELIPDRDKMHLWRIAPVGNHRFYWALHPDDIIHNRHIPLYRGDAEMAIGAML